MLVGFLCSVNTETLQTHKNCTITITECLYLLEVTERITALLLLKGFYFL